MSYIIQSAAAFLAAYLLWRLNRHLQHGRKIQVKAVPTGWVVVVHRPLSEPITIGPPFGTREEARAFREHLEAHT